MPDRDKQPQTRQRSTPAPGPSLTDLVTSNPHLTLADILALWHWIGPSSQVH